MKSRNYIHIHILLAISIVTSHYETFASGEITDKPKNNLTYTTSTTIPIPTTSKAIPQKYRFVHRIGDKHNIAYKVWQGTSLNLDCEIETLYKKPKIIWLKDGAPIQTKIYRFYYANNIDERFTLNFERILLEESGKYSCIVGNDGDDQNHKIEKIFQIHVEEISRLEKLHVQSLLPENPELIKGENFIFTCVTSGYPDSVKYFQWDLLTPSSDAGPNTWRSPEDNLRYSVQQINRIRSSGKNSTVELKDVSDKLDKAKISCAVFDKNGFDRKVATLKVIEPSPKPPKNDDIRSDGGSGGPSAAVIVVVVVLVIILIMCAVLFFLKRIKTTKSQKRKHSYFYDKPPLDTSIS